MKQNIATVTKAFKGAPDGQRVTNQFKPGDKVTGELAVIAVVNGWASFDGQASENKAKTAAPENKAKEGTFRGNDGGDSGERSKSDKRTSRPRKKTSGKSTG